MDKKKSRYTDGKCYGRHQMKKQPMGRKKCMKCGKVMRNRKPRKVALRY